MTRPTKRQRLTIAQHDNVAGLERARHANDMRLKSEFEAIFAKYSKDFSEIGDEIDLKTGEIVVDNGHLATMRHELDVGVEVGSPGATGWGDEEQDFRYNGHGNVESMGEDDDADSMLAPDDEADDGTIEEQTTSVPERMATATKTSCRPIVGGASSSLTASRVDALLWNNLSILRSVLAIDIHLKGGKPTVTR
ncbi:hypothetical protein H2201_008475 [Coniosporium apollinis]|uniref:Myb-like domain-containing protein n=1 Tax=Coniosporium apollinis TaxID=61459 RepID=A0ABQ9NG36_9PEZI|nr:hypothetical protein H2201_008475 [Coniosporium apollinis]